MEQKIVRVAKPQHPGTVLRILFLSDSGLTQAELADALRVSRRTISEIVNGHRSVTIDMANRLSLFFGTSAQFWINMQLALDIWEATDAHRAEYRLIKSFARTRAAKKPRKELTVA